MPAAQASAATQCGCHCDRLGQGATRCTGVFSLSMPIRRPATSASAWASNRVCSRANVGRDCLAPFGAYSSEVEDPLIDWLIVVRAVHFSAAAITAGVPIFLAVVAERAFGASGATTAGR